MAKSRYSGKFAGKKYKIEVDLDVYIWSENGIYFAYAPALDLTGYDTTEEKAKASFSNVLDTTLHYMHNKDTIFNELERLGWTVNRKKRRVNAPDLQELMNDNEEFKNLLNKPDYKKERKEVQLSLA